MKAPEVPDLSRALAVRSLLAVAVMTLLVTALAHRQMPLAPHSSHDAFLLIPQLMHLLEKPSHKSQFSSHFRQILFFSK